MITPQQEESGNPKPGNGHDKLATLSTGLGALGAAAGTAGIGSALGLPNTSGDMAGNAAGVLDNASSLL